jgi:lysophospholipase L1-like esterase
MFAGAGGRPLPPRPRARRIEFIGDSYTVGYGNASPGRACTAREVHDRTDTQRAFGPLLAKRLDADYRVIAYSGFGVVRNYAGGRPGESLPGLYPRAVPDDPAPLDTDEGWWPQVIVINLGTNDFSTPLKAGEAWASAEALRAAWRERYVAFAESLLSRRPEAQLVLMGAEAFEAEVEQVAAALNAVARAKPVATVRFGGLELTGCDYHPSLADHEALADLIEKKLAGLPQLWR